MCVMAERRQAPQLPFCRAWPGRLRAVLGRHGLPCVVSTTSGEDVFSRAQVVHVKAKLWLGPTAVGLEAVLASSVGCDM